jgi:hypothetical protein
MTAPNYSPLNPIGAILMTSNSPSAKPPAAPRRRPLAAMRMIRQQSESFKQVDWKPVKNRLSWQEAIVLIVVRGAGRIDLRSLLAITGLPEADVAAALHVLWIIDYVKRAAYKDGTYFVAMGTAND